MGSPPARVARAFHTDGWMESRMGRTDPSWAALKKAASRAVADDSDAVFGDSLVLAAIAME